MVKMKTINLGFKIYNSKLSQKTVIINSKLFPKNSYNKDESMVMVKKIMKDRVGASVITRRITFAWKIYFPYKLSIKQTRKGMNYTQLC